MRAWLPRAYHMLTLSDQQIAALLGALDGGDNGPLDVISQVIGSDWIASFAYVLQLEIDAVEASRGRSRLDDAEEVVRARFANLHTEQSEACAQARRTFSTRINGLRTIAEVLSDGPRWSRPDPVERSEALWSESISVAAGPPRFARLTPETHRGGLSPMKIDFDSSVMVFKPRSAETANLWDAIAMEARRNSVPVPLGPRRWRTGDFYIEEWVRPDDNRDDPVAAFSALAAAAAVLLMSDLHCENVLVSRQAFVVPVDLETMFQTDVFDVGPPDERWFIHALRRTGLFGGVGTTDSVVQKVTSLVGGRSDKVLSDVAGLLRQYLPIVQKVGREVFEESCAPSETLKCRMPLRNTRWYGGVFERIAYSDGAALPSRVWDFLTGYPFCVNVKTEVDRVSLLREEFRDMLVGDVPMFEADVFGGGLRSRIDGAVIAKLEPPARAARDLWSIGVERGLRATSHAQLVWSLSG